MLVLFIILGVIALVAIGLTLREVARDGYRRIPDEPALYRRA